MNYGPAPVSACFLFPVSCSPSPSPSLSVSPSFSWGAPSHQTVCIHGSNVAVSPDIWCLSVPCLPYATTSIMLQYITTSQTDHHWPLYPMTELVRLWSYKYPCCVGSFKVNIYSNNNTTLLMFNPVKRPESFRPIEWRIDKWSCKSFYPCHCSLHQNFKLIEIELINAAAKSEFLINELLIFYSRVTVIWSNLLLASETDIYIHDSEWHIHVYCCR